LLFGAVASNSTAFRVIDKIASTPGLLAALDGAHARAREQVWKLTGAPRRVTIDLDATLLTSHSDKEGAAGNYKGGYGFHPMLAYCDETREAMAALLRDCRIRAAPHVRVQSHRFQANIPPYSPLHFDTPLHFGTPPPSKQGPPSLRL